MILAAGSPRMPGAQEDRARGGAGRSLHSEGYSRKLYSPRRDQAGLRQSPTRLVTRQRRSSTTADADVLETLHSCARKKAIRTRPSSRLPSTPSPASRCQDLELFRPTAAPGRAGRSSTRDRRTYYVVIEGTGATEVGGKRFEWAQQRSFRRAELPVAAHINTQDRRGDLFRLRRRADEGISASIMRRAARRTAR